ncbi:MAG: hypothetical protein AB8D52_01870 [Gammaproteobacteria bacterium]
MNNDIFILMGLVALYTMSISLFRYCLSRSMNSHKSLAGIYILVFVIIGVMPSILIKLKLINQTTASVTAAIIFFITFAGVASCLLLKKNFGNE